MLCLKVERIWHELMEWKLATPKCSCLTPHLCSRCPQKLDVWEHPSQVDPFRQELPERG